MNDRPPDRCPRCGEATGGGEVCQSCGVSLSGNRPAPKTQSSGGMAPKASSTRSAAARCTGCGRAMAPGDQFCADCGLPVSSGGTPRTQTVPPPSYSVPPPSYSVPPPSYSVPPSYSAPPSAERRRGVGCLPIVLIIVGLGAIFGGPVSGSTAGGVILGLVVIGFAIYLITKRRE